MVTNLVGGNKRTLAVLKKSENDEGERETRGRSANSFKQQSKKIIVFGDSSDVKKSYKNFGQHDKFDKTPASPKSARTRDSNCKGNCPHGETDPEANKGQEETLSKAKKKKKKSYYPSRCLSICTSNCKYEVIRRVAARFGMREVTEDSSWNLYWTDLSVSIERAKDMKRFQKINHFPGMTELCRKDLLARNLNRMLKLFPQDYNFFPKTWCFPADLGEAMAYAKIRRSKTFIIKPDTGCQGRGIYLTKNLKDVKPYDRLICQVYISRPFLIDGFKFDLRVYTLITSCDPLRIYIYNDGLVRFATSRYKEPTTHNTSNVFMHLTNYAVNKHSRMFVVDDEVGNDPVMSYSRHRLFFGGASEDLLPMAYLKISTLNKWLNVKSVNVEELWTKIDEVIVKTVLAAYPILKHSYHTCFPTHDLTYACFELLGFDILLDWKLKPYLLEVNHSPSFHTDAQIDKDVKESLLMDTFEMLNLQLCDKRKVMEEDRKRIRERLLQGINNNKETNLNETTMDQVKIEKDPIQVQQKWEDEHMGNFRRVYPGPQCEKYDPFFKQTVTSMFQDTAASRAREEASKLQREETDMRIKEQENKRIGGKWSEYKVGPESPGSKKLNCTQERIKSVPVTRKPIKKSTPPRSPPIIHNNLFSFEPEIISESEERERVTAMAQRDFLMKSYGILEQIYLSMKKNGVLRTTDERKYALYGKLGCVSEIMSNNLTQKPNFSYQNGTSVTKSKYTNFMNETSQYNLKVTNGEKIDNPREECNFNDCLKVTCNEIPIYTRPNISKNLWIEDLNSEDRDARITKTHLARTLSNAARLHAIEKRDNYTVRERTFQL